MSQRLRVRASLGAGVCQVFGGAMRLCWGCHLHTSCCTQLPDINQMNTTQTSNLHAPNPTQPALSTRVSYSFEDRGQAIQRSQLRALARQEHCMLRTAPLELWNCPWLGTACCHESSLCCFPSLDGTPNRRDTSTIALCMLRPWGRPHAS